MSIDDVYAVVVDSDIAAAMSMVAAGDIDSLVDVCGAAPHLGRVSFVGAYLAAVLAFRGDAAHQRALTAIRAAAERGSETQRSAGALRLRRLAEDRPEPATRLRQLADILTGAIPPVQSPPPATP